MNPMLMLIRGPQRRHATAEPRIDPAEGSPPWAILCPPGTVTVPVERARQVLASLAPGTPVALVTNGPLARRSLRRVCRAGDVRIDRELVALPSADRPLVLFDDDARSVARFWSGVAAIPPAPGWVTAPATLVLAVAARVPWQWTGALAPGRVLIGERR
jgi:hypothetical protein